MVNLSSLHLVTLSVIIAAYLTIGTLYATQTPAWQVPDEPAHYNYIRQIVETGALPVMQVGDYDQAYLEKLTGERFPPELSVRDITYQDYQPPLYYLLAAPVFVIFGGALVPLRLLSLALGAGVIGVACLAVRELFPARPWLALTAAGFIAFIPQHVAMMAGVNNDSLSELVIAVGLWLILRQNRTDLAPGPLALVLGLAFVTKVQAYILAPVIGLLWLMKWRQAGWGAWRRFARLALAIFVPALLIGSLYWGRNLSLYGWPDFVGGLRHTSVVTGQPTTADWVAQHGWLGQPDSLLNRLAIFTFQSFWGQFGWMGVVMDQRVYWALAAFSVGLGVGVVGVSPSWKTLGEAERAGVILLMVSGALTVLLYIYYNLGYVQHQGRYLFPALLPISAAAAVGLWQWANWIAALLQRAPVLSRLARYAASLTLIVPMACLAALCVFALYRFILPQLA